MTARRLLYVASVLTMISGLMIGACGDETTSGPTVSCSDGTELKDGACVPAGNLCPLGQVYANGECRAEMTTGLECGPGTEPNAAGTQCVSTGGGTDLNCGPGTIEQDGACVPDPDALIECGEGTIDDGAGNCVAVNPCDAGEIFDGTDCIDPPMCEAGTIANVDGDCVPVDPTEDIEVAEGDENNDPVIGEGTATTFTLRGEGQAIVLGGVIGAPSDLVPEEAMGGQEPEVVLEPDFDGFEFSGGKGQRIAIEGTAVGAPDLGWIVEYVPAEGEEREYIRLAMPVLSRNTYRQYVLPFDGVYRIRVSTANNVETAAFQGGFAWEGGEDFSYLLAVTPLPPASPETEVNAGFEWSGGEDGLWAVPHLELGVAAGTIVDLSMSVESNVVIGQAILTSPDFTAFYGYLDAGAPQRIEVPEGGLLITADYQVALEPNLGFTITSIPVPIQGIADLNPDEPIQGELAESGGIDWYSFQIAGPTVVSVSLQPGDASRAEVGVLVANADFEFFSPGSGPPPLYGEGPASLQAFLATPGTYFFAIVDLNRPGTFTGAYTYEISLSSVAVPLFGTGTLDLDANATQTATADVPNSGDAAWFAVELSELLRADLTAAPAVVDAAVLVFEEGQISERGINTFEIAGADVGFAAENEELAFAGEGWRLIRVSNVGDFADDGLVTLTVTTSNPFEGLVAEQEPNDGRDAAQDVGEVTLDTQGTVAGNFEGTPAQTFDWYRFTLANPSIVSASTYPGLVGGADTIVNIVDAQGATLARNDDRDLFGGDLYSTATASLPAGTFYVLVESFARSANGDYVLVVTVDEEFSVCAPGYAVCNGGNLDVCNAAGDGFDATACPQGCETIEGVGDICTTDVELDADNNDQWQGADAINLVIDGVYELDGDIGLIEDNFEDLTDWYVFTLSANPDEQGLVTIETGVNQRAPFSTDPDAISLYRADDLSTPIADGLFGSAVGPVWLGPGTYYIKVESFGGFFGAFGGYRLVITHQSTVCQPGTGTCSGADFNACNADGSAIELMACAFGCGAQVTGDGCNVFEEAEPNGDGATANDVGTIASGLTAPIEGVIESTATERDYDWYSFTLAGDSIVTIETSAGRNAASVDTVIFLYDETETQLDTDDDGGEGLFSLIGPSFLSAGTYYVSVQLFGATTSGAYHLDIRVQEPLCEVGATACDGDDITECNGLEFVVASTCDTGCSADALGVYCNPPAATVLDPVVSVTEGTIAEADETDWFTFELTDVMTLSMTLGQGMDATDHDSRIYICSFDQVRGGGCAYGFFGDNIAYDDQSGGNGWSAMTLELDPGVYYIGVEFWDGETGDYTLTVAVPPAGPFEPNDTFAEATPIGLGETLTAGIELEGDVDWFVFTLAADTTVNIETRQGAATDLVDTQIWLCDGADPANCTYSAGNLDSDDDSGEGTYSLITGAALSAGTYYVGVRGYTTSTGGYDLTVSEPPPAPYEPNNSATEAAPINVGETLTAAIETGADEDWFTFTLAADATVTFTTTLPLGGRSVDTRIWVCDTSAPAVCSYSSGNIARNDDVVGLYSEIADLALTAGTYFIVVESWGGTGDYELTLQ